MKKQFLFIFILLIIISCDSENSEMNKLINGIDAKYEMLKLFELTKLHY